ncbi:MAG TPA: (d)CMP kinase [Clostridia bacterium]|nr:(d)CMP kinase [Clostridia bacterium]
MISIAIDGPSGAGKSTMAKIIAKENGFIYLDTGAMYRAFALHVLNNNYSIDEINNDIVKELFDSFSLDIQYVEDKQQMILNNENVSNRIRTPEVSLAASRIATLPAVREYFVKMQREFAKNKNVVMDGRDIGSNVLKDADVKIFLTAAVEDRARRRFEELREKGNTEVTFEEVLEDMKLRDKIDSSREIAPLTKAEDAVEINTTGLEIEQSLELIRKVIKEKLCGF